MSPKTSNNGFLFPLYLSDAPVEENLSKTGDSAPNRKRRANLSPQFVADFAGGLRMRFTGEGRGDLANTFGPEDVFHYIYAIFHSPSYRSRYAEFLKTDFPRVPAASDAGLFRRLCTAGADLVALHLLEEDYEAASWNASEPKGESPLKTLITRFAGEGCAQVARGYPRYGEGNVHINSSSYFEGVPEEVWSFYVGGYQVCEKWLKSRRGRRLTDEDITLYRRIVAALHETIRLMAEIDKTIEEHGGWPLGGENKPLSHTKPHE